MPVVGWERQQSVGRVTLRRPEVRNALNPELIRELGEAFREAGADPEVRVVVLAAEGPAFCAGADIEWMRSAVDAPFEQVVQEAMELGRMFRAVYDCPKPVVARIQGAAFGGGAGLVAMCDLAVAVEQAVLCFSEVKLGIAPALISPFVLRKLPPGLVRRYFLTAERIPAPEAVRVGLLTETAPDEAALDAAIDRWAHTLSANGPVAMAAVKRLVDDVAGPITDEMLHFTASRIAELRTSPEGQEGFRAFLERRQPQWGPHPPAPSPSAMERGS